MLSVIVRVLLLTSLLLQATAVTAVEQRNVLNMSEGTVVLSYSGEYDGAKWSALNAFDGDPKTGWCSPKNSIAGESFVVELPQRYKLEKTAVDNRQVQEKDYPGISAKTIEVWGSTTAADTGFVKLTTIAATRQGRTVVTLAGAPEAQWLKFVVAGNWGDKKYVEVCELEAYGQPVGKAVNPSFTGVFSTNWGPMKVQQDGLLVVGCYPHRIGSLRGAVDGHVLRFDWLQKEGKTNGTALMVLNSAGTVLNGAWYTNGQIRGEWLGKRDDGLECKCEPTGDSSIGDRLKEAKRAIVYGIHFDTDSAVIKPESQKALSELLSALNQQPTIKVQIEGHTDSSNTDQYNQTLSQKRAQAVVTWLQAKGIAAARMTARGFGESKPVADNATPQGRALNRRVEISVVD